MFFAEDFGIGIDKILLKRNFLNMLLLFLRRLRNRSESGALETRHGKKPKEQTAGPGNKSDQVDELLLYSKQKDETVVLENHDVPEDLWILGKPHMCQDLSRLCTSDSVSHPYSVQF